VPTILLIRHGQASYGTGDYDRLSPRGREQARVTASELTRRGLTVVRVLSGSLRRQRDTAAPVAAALALPVALDPRFNEYDMDEILAAHADTGVRTNVARGAKHVSSAEFQRILERGMMSWIEAGDASTCREPWPRFDARVTAALTDLAGGLSSGSTAVVFTSAGVVAALCRGILGLPAEAVVPLNRVSVNAGITKLACGRSGISFVSFNEHAHLEYGGSELVTLR
jgi:broad specificity phosphatase PhoE